MDLDFFDIFKKSPDATMIVEVSSDVKVVEVNHACQRLFKSTSLEEFKNASVFEFSPKFQRCGRPSPELGREMVMKMIEQGHHSFDWQHRDFEGNTIDCSVHGSSVKSEDKFYIIATIRDITQRIQQEETIQKQADFFQATIDTMPAIFYAKNLEGVFTHVNQEFLNLVKKQRSEVINKSVYDIFPKEVADGFRKTDQEVEASKLKNESEEFAFDTEGKRLVYHSFKFPYFDEKGNVISTGGISLDVTENRRLQEIVMHQSKLASLGEMSARVGHEINNPLTIIRVYLEILKEGALDDTTTAEYLDVLDRASHRIAVIVDELRKFARKDSHQKIVFDATIVINEVYQLMSDLLSKEGIIFELNCDYQKSINLYGYSGRLHQILINLINNAKDAVEENNRPDKIIKLTVVQNKNILSIKIADNGSGIPENSKKLIFDPFYTTKEVNKGTGIGLALVHNFVMDFEGQINFTTGSEGTDFVLELPITSKELTNKPTPKVKTCDYPIKVLVIDDEEGIRDFTELLLSKHGASVACAKDSIEAREILKENTFDLIFSDVNMPGESGVELLNSYDFGKKVPFIVINTGGVIEDFNSSSQYQKIDSYVLKPFEEKDLLRILELAYKRKFSD